MRNSLPVRSNSPFAVSSSQTWRPSGQQKRKFRTYEGLPRRSWRIVRPERSHDPQGGPARGNRCAASRWPRLFVSKNKSCIVTAPRLACDGIPFEGHYVAGHQCIRQVGLVLLERSFRLLALRDIDVRTDEAWSCSIAVVEYEARVNRSIGSRRRTGQCDIRNSIRAAAQPWPSGSPPPRQADHPGVLWFAIRRGWSPLSPRASRGWLHSQAKPATFPLPMSNA